MSEAGGEYYRRQAAAIGIEADDFPTILDGQPVRLPKSGESLSLQAFGTRKAQAVVNELADHLTTVDRFVLTDVPADEDTGYTVLDRQYPYNKRYVAKAAGSLLVPGKLATGTLHGLYVEAVDPESDLSPVVMRNARDQILMGIPGAKSGSTETTEAFLVISAFFTSGLTKRLSTANLLTVRAVVAPGQPQCATVQYTGLQLTPRNYPDTLLATQRRADEGITESPSYKVGNQRAGMPRSGPHRK